MSEHFPKEFFAGNRERLQSLFSGTAPIVITANGLLQSSADMTFPFKQDSSFWYLTGISEPGAILVLDKGKEYIIMPVQEKTQLIFDGKQSVANISQISGISQILDNKTGWNALSSRAKKVKHIATLAALPNYVASHGFYTNPARAQLVELLKVINPKLEFLDLRQHLTTLRMVKQPLEIQAVQKAIDATIKTIRSISRKSWASYRCEYDVETDIVASFRRLGGEGAAFDSIVAAGSHAGVIHHQPNKDNLPNKGFVLLDVGAQFTNYAADISRTFSIGKPTKRMQQVYNAVFEVQQNAIGLLRPGIIIGEYETEVVKFMGEKLRELGLLKTIDNDTVRQFFPHATSHHLGLDTHDISDYTKPLAENMIVTVEPGIYIESENFGVRIEDDILITAEGNKIMTNGLSRELLSITIKGPKSL